jgi:hypothetical protein
MIAVISETTINAKRAINSNGPRTSARGLRRLVLAVDSDAIELHSVIDQPIAQFLGDQLL